MGLTKQLWHTACTYHADTACCVFQLVPQLCQCEPVQQAPLARTALTQRGGMVGTHVATRAAGALQSKRVQGSPARTPTAAAAAK